VTTQIVDHTAQALFSLPGRSLLVAIFFGSGKGSRATLGKPIPPVPKSGPVHFQTDEEADLTGGNRGPEQRPF
jgi:hypothetical protein